jgi:very-short-patch-repair endonuclease
MQQLYQYTSKKFLMTPSEHECYNVLLQTFGDTYYIFPQIHLPTIVYAKRFHQPYRRFFAAFTHINQKSVDFVLCDKRDISPKLVIELDDSTNLKPKRIRRDKEVERILNTVHLPIFRIPHDKRVDTIYIKQGVENVLKQQNNHK